MSKSIELERAKMRVAQAYATFHPKATCRCGHSGDGANSDHEDHVQAGHGICRRTGCDCFIFAWKAWTPAFAAVLEAVKGE